MPTTARSRTRAKNDIIEALQTGSSIGSSFATATLMGAGAHKGPARRSVGHVPTGSLCDRRAASAPPKCRGGSPLSLRDRALHGSRVPQGPRLPHPRGRESPKYSKAHLVRTYATQLVRITSSSSSSREQAHLVSSRAGTQPTDHRASRRTLACPSPREPAPLVSSSSSGAARSCDCAGSADSPGRG